MKNVAIKIKNQRELLNMSQEKLANLVGYTSRSTIARIENGEIDLPMSKLIDISSALKVPPSYLMGWTDENGNEIQSSASTSALRVPVYGSVPAGVPLEAIENVVDYEELSPAMAIGGKEFFALKVVGDSMYPKYMENDVIILEKCNDCESGSDCVVFVNGYDATLKKVIKEIDGVVLQPLNPAYDPKFYSNNDEDYPISIIGKVIEIRRKV